MGIEWRNGRPYLYERKRVNGRLRGTYVCALKWGTEGLLRTQMAQDRIRREEARFAVEEVAEWAARVLDAGAAFDRLADQVFRAVMFLTGHRLHKRAEWRRARGVKAMARANELGGGPRDVKPGLVCPAADDPEAQRILDRAARGDQSALPAVREFLTDVRRTGNFGSVAGWAQSALVSAAAGDNVLLTEAVKNRVSEHTARLLADGGPNPTLAERMAATRAAHNWLTVHILEVKRENFDADSKKASALDKAICRAERRLHAALKSLAVLRRLRNPVVVTQVNVANGPMLVAPPQRI